MERQRWSLNNGSVSILPLQNDQQRKHIGCGIGSGSGDGVPPGGTDMQSIMAAACSGGGGVEKGRWKNCEEVKWRVYKG